MAHALWTGSISFGLLNIPVQLVPGERRTELRFHLMDTRNKARVRYERINSETGEEVPWQDIVKAFEYKKGSYVVLADADLKAAAPQSSQSVDIESFVPADAVPMEYFERPYYLVPTKKAEKSYVLLRETLRALNRVGLARVVIRTREYLALVVPREAALMLMLIRYPQELLQAHDYALPDRAQSAYRISPQERKMAQQLVESMSGEWRPTQYKDEFRARLSKVIETRLRRKGTRVEPAAAAPTETADNVVDLMAVLRRSLEQHPGRPKRASSHDHASRARHRSTAGR